MIRPPAAVGIVIRPESVGVGYRQSHGKGADAVVRQRTFYGHDQLLHLELDDGMRVRSRIDAATYRRWLRAALWVMALLLIGQFIASMSSS